MPSHFDFDDFDLTNELVTPLLNSETLLMQHDSNDFLSFLPTSSYALLYVELKLNNNGTKLSVLIKEGRFLVSCYLFILFIVTF